MTGKKKNPPPSVIPADTKKTLRQKAEDALRKQHAARGLVAPEDAKRLHHELEVHQIELEMQNEELRRAQAELEASRQRYFDFYDLAPVGYFTISEEGLILEANLMSATLLGVDRSSLRKQPLSRYIVAEDADIYYLHSKKLFKTGKPQACETRMHGQNDILFWVHLDATVAQVDDGAPVCRVVLSDITDMKTVQEALQKALDDVRTLRGIVPICASCKKIRDGEGYWSQLEAYVQDHTEVKFSHSICPECIATRYSDFVQSAGRVPKNKGAEGGV